MVTNELQLAQTSVIESPVEVAVVRERPARQRLAIPTESSVRRAAHSPRVCCDLTVIVPAYNEAASLADTILSLQAQTVPPQDIIVVDDCSTDGTAAVAEALGVTVMCPPRNTGSKAGAQNFALTMVRTTLTMAIDADTTLAPDAIEKLLPAFDDPHCAAACGFVLPRYIRTVWERGRYVEYLMAFTWYKTVQEYYEKPMISSGCFSMYRTSILREHDGWPTRTLAEDMDLTWSLHLHGHGVRFIDSAISYPIEPHDFHFMSKQLRRWSHGFMQNIMLHWKELVEVPFLRSFIGVALWDAVIASIAFLFVIPLLIILLRLPWLLVIYVLDLPIVFIPVLVKAIQMKENVPRALVSVPCFLVLRLVNSYFVFEAFLKEIVLKKSFRQYEKGH